MVRGGCTLTASAMARICAGVVPQQPPTMFTSPPDAKSRAIFVKGYHPYGKVALSHPLNYAAPNRVPLAVPPNIGYVAQSFYVADLDGAAATCKRLDANVFSSATSLDIPHVGSRRAMVVRNPGSGALMQLIESN